MSLLFIIFSLVEEKATIVRRLLQEVELGVEEAAMMSQLASHLSGLEGERAKLRAQVKIIINNLQVYEFQYLRSLIN